MSDPVDRVETEAQTPEGGVVEMIIQPEGQRVIQRFPRPMLWLAYERDNAAHVGKALIDAAVAIGAKVQIKVPPRKISEEKREALVARAYHVHRSMTEQKRPPKDIARHVVDAVLSAIE